MFFLLLLSSFFPLLTQPIPRLLKSIALAAIVYSTLQHGPPPPPQPPSKKEGCQTRFWGLIKTTSGSISPLEQKEEK
jgi:hypothetical protein